MKILSDFFKSISSDSTVNIDNDTLESFTDEKILAISILLIEVSKSDDYYDELEKNKIIEIIREKFSLDKNQIDLLINLDVFILPFLFVKIIVFLDFKSLGFSLLSIFLASSMPVSPYKDVM